MKNQRDALLGYNMIQGVYDLARDLRLSTGVKRTCYRQNTDIYELFTDNRSVHITDGPQTDYGLHTDGLRTDHELHTGT